MADCFLEDKRNLDLFLDSPERLTGSEKTRAEGKKAQDTIGSQWEILEGGRN